MTLPRCLLLAVCCTAFAAGLAVAQVAPPAKPADPAKPDEPGAPVDPKKVEYPKIIEGKDLAGWLRESQFQFQKDAQLREIAIKIIPGFGPDARKPAIKPMIDVIDFDPDPGVRIAAITVISNMGFDVREQVKPAIGALRRTIQNTGQGSILRLFCVRSLGSFGTDAVGATGELRALVTDPAWETRVSTANTLGQIGMPVDDPKAPPGKKPSASKAAAELLHKMLSDPCAAVRLEAAQALLGFGPPPLETPEQYKADVIFYLKPVVDRIKEEKAKGDKNVYLWLVLLEMMYDDRTFDANLKIVAKAVQEPEGKNVAQLRMTALNVLTVLGPKAAPALPQVLDALKYDEPELVLSAMNCLANIGNEARAAVAELEKIKGGSKDKDQKPPKDAPKDWKPDPTLRLAAAEAIDYITGKKKILDMYEEKKKEKEKEKEKK